MNKVSLITTSRGLPLELAKAVLEVQSFTQKLPVPWELVIILDPPFSAPLPPIASTDRFEVRLLKNDKKLGRSKSLLRGLQAATGDVIITFSLDMTIPLAEIFQFLQELTVDPELDLIIGNRYTSRKKMTSLRSSWHQTLEKILLEKYHRKEPRAFTDPLCAYFGLRKESFAKVSQNLNFNSWYFMPELLIEARKQKWKILEAPILSRDEKPSAIPLFKEYSKAALRAY